MKNAFLFVCVFVVALSSCNPKVSKTINKSYSAIPFDKEILILNINDSIPKYSEELGTVKIGDTGFTTKCTYEMVLALAKIEARGVGGNAIKITEHKMPTALGSMCHRIKAQILLIQDVEKYLLTEQLIHEEWNYSLLHIYRFSGQGFAVSYKLHLEDSLLTKVSNKFYDTVKVYKEGPQTIWARTESRDEVTIDFEFGKEYYLRCALGIGAFIGRPDLTVVNWKTGKGEFETFSVKE